MRRKAIIVLAITFLVTVMATAFSYFYIAEILAQHITDAYDSADRLTKQIAYFASNDLPDLSSTRVDTNDPEAVRRALAEYLPMDTNLLNSLQSDLDWPNIYDASIVDARGKVLLHTNAQLVGKQALQRPDFNEVKTARFRKQFALVFRPAVVYDVTSPLLLNGVPFGTIRIGVSTVPAEERNPVATDERRLPFHCVDFCLAAARRRCLQSRSRAAQEDQPQLGHRQFGCNRDALRR